MKKDENGKSWPTVSHAKILCETFKKRGVIIFTFSGEQYGYASYGETKSECRMMETLADKMFAAVDDVLTLYCAGRVSAAQQQSCTCGMDSDGAKDCPSHGVPT